MTTFRASRQWSIQPSEIYCAISDPTRLAKWWGPSGFTNQFDVFDFRPHGKWIFTMIGPDRTSYPNESVFTHIEANRQVVIQHVCQPHFELSITLEANAEGTLLTWQQTFADDAVAKAIEHIVVPSNEQNLDRLATELGLMPSSK
jgi:uncharacterized protein YndB with AHSA1/START domain